MKIEILGTGCPKCRKTEEMISAAIRKLGIEAEIVHVTNINEIIDRGVMMTPAVLVDGEKKIEGRIPTEAQIREWLRK
ncbi:MAG TPA: thioredoxin family protein [Firmicutes bacterium]|nr:thioredoxin family protein [Bacillota bacterium]HHY97463.1 thioredoxin family protein [Bacillota bacterium]